MGYDEKKCGGCGRGVAYVPGGGGVEVREREGREEESDGEGERVEFEDSDDDDDDNEGLLSKPLSGSFKRLPLNRLATDPLPPKPKPNPSTAKEQKLYLKTLSDRKAKTLAEKNETAEHAAACDEDAANRKFFKPPKDNALIARSAAMRAFTSSFILTFSTASSMVKHSKSHGPKKKCAPSDNCTFCGDHYSLSPTLTLEQPSHMPSFKRVPSSPPVKGKKGKRKRVIDARFAAAYNKGWLGR